MVHIVPPIEGVDTPPQNQRSRFLAELDDLLANGTRVMRDHTSAIDDDPCHVTHCDCGWESA